MKFLEAVSKLQSSNQAQGLTLQSFLVLPMQRITRLPLLVNVSINRYDQTSHDPHQNMLTYCMQPCWIRLHFSQACGIHRRCLFGIIPRPSCLNGGFNDFRVSVINLISQERVSSFSYPKLTRFRIDQPFPSSTWADEQVAAE